MGSAVVERYRHMRPVVPFADPDVGSRRPFTTAAVPQPTTPRATPLPLEISGDDDAPAEKLETIIERTSSYAPDGSLVRRLEDLLNRPLPAVRIHANTEADRVARHADADAVTMGDRVLFREGQFQPDRPAGLALFAHEMVHAETIASTPRSRAAWPGEEHEALRVERAVLTHAAAQPTPKLTAVGATPAPGLAAGSGVGAYSPAATAPASKPPSVPAGLRTAARGREVSVPAADEGVPRAANLTDRQMNEIKEAVYEDLMDRIRTDFERGG